MKRFHNRFWFFQSFIMSGFISALIFFVGLQGYLFFAKKPVISINISFWLFFYILAIQIIVGGYFGLKNSTFLKGQFGDIHLFISGLKSGKLSDRMNRSENEEMGPIVEELNQLAVYLEEQAFSIQRMADEKVSLAQSAHTAAVMEERQRLARDLHDVVSQQLFALSMLSSATLRLIDKQPEKVKEQITEIADIAIKAQGEMRALLLHLRPVQLTEDSLCEGIIKLIKELKEKTKLEFQASIDEIEDLSTAAEEHLFRIIQEALSNILLHSEASKVKITLAEREHDIYLYISDNGRGFDPSKDRFASYGLKTMRERCEEIGGVFNIRSKAMEGTYIDIRILKKVREKDARN
ncbi:sensor histidine kinase [Bacillus sp. CGMCC 1.16607]|uniref:sensor histidine kinase n=1 Tax=Bacillus sp. CGMCC 1.16607 TaxID=3351842 RepID=UPI003641B50E